MTQHPSPQVVAARLQRHGSDIAQHRLHQTNLHDLPDDARQAVQDLSHRLPQAVLEPALRRLHDHPDRAVLLLDLFGLNDNP